MRKGIRLGDYTEFLDTKLEQKEPTGKQPGQVSSVLFPFQQDLVRWAVSRGRAAIFADTGLGKTFMQLEWARLVGEKTLIVAPLAVAHQTIREAEQLGMDVGYATSQSE